MIQEKKIEGRKKKTNMFTIVLNDSPSELPSKDRLLKR